VNVGILALQGGFAAHARVITALGHEAVLVRQAAELDAVDGLILPGGESSTHLRLLDREALTEPLSAFVSAGKPVLATCAGLILAARDVTAPQQESFGWLDVSVTRNGWGRQLDSFEAVADSEALPLVFIRAPRITSVGAGAEVLATLKEEPVMVRQANVVGATFHPELTDDLRVHTRVFGSAA